MTHDPVNHPSHYCDGGIETIDFIEAKKMSYHLGNAVKYISRAGKKDDELQDLKKARWYLNRYIELREKEKITLVDGDNHFEVVDENTGKRERRLCYNCVHCDMNHPAPGEFARCRRDGRQVYDSMYANLCDYYEEKDVERYPITDARITFDSEKQRDEFKTLLEKERENEEVGK